MAINWQLILIDMKLISIKMTCNKRRNMKRIYATSAIIGGIMAAIVIAGSAFAPLVQASVTKSIHVEWGYTPPSAPAVSGYRLYQDGKHIFTVTDPKATETDCSVLSSSKSTSFTLTATFVDGTESEHSGVYQFLYNRPLQPGPTIKSVVISGTDFTITPVR